MILDAHGRALRRGIGYHRRMVMVATQKKDPVDLVGSTSIESEESEVETCERDQGKLELALARPRS